MNTKNMKWYIAGAVIIIVVGAYFFTRAPKEQSGQTPTKTQQSVSNTNNVPTTSSSTNTPTEDPQDIVPGLYKNPIQNTATQEGFVITDSKVENNIDKSGKATDDHLELTLKNTAGKDLSDVEVYYLITDTTTGQEEGYYKKLTGFDLKSGDTQAIHFDNGTDSGHFNANKDSLYYKSPNKLIFDISVNTAGYKTQTVQIAKDAGGAEQND